MIIRFVCTFTEEKLHVDMKIFILLTISNNFLAIFTSLINDFSISLNAIINSFYKLFHFLFIFSFSHLHCIHLHDFYHCLFALFIITLFMQCNSLVSNNSPTIMYSLDIHSDSLIHFHPF